MTNNEVENYILRRMTFILVRTSSLSLRESIDTFFLGFSDSCSRSPTRSPLASARRWIAAAESLKSAVVLHASFLSVPLKLDQKTIFPRLVGGQRRTVRTGGINNKQTLFEKKRKGRLGRYLDFVVVVAFVERGKCKQNATPRSLHRHADDCRW